MKRILAGTLIALSTVPALAADVGVSVSISEPGFYGRIELGDVPQPRLIYAEPVIVEHVSVVRAPVYMHVPPGHAKDWPKHCGKYNACGQRVLFVQDEWYNDVYVPHEKQKQGKGNKAKGHGKGKHGKD